MPRFRTNEIIPGRLYQRGQFLTFDRKNKLAALEELDITLVVNLWTKPDPDLEGVMDKTMYLNWPIWASRIPNEETLECVVELISNHLKHSAALIHCEAGKGRSVFLSALVLAHVNRWDGEQVMKQINELVPGHRLTPVFVNYLEALRY